jgi:dienelactone hydrolase
VEAPDLFFRFGGTEAVDPMELIRHLDIEQAQRDIGVAADLVRGLGAEKVGVTGFCMGGRLTYRSAVAAHHEATTVYPLAGHGFMRDGSPDFVPAAAADAWDKLLAHFRAYL